MGLTQATLADVDRGGQEPADPAQVVLLGRPRRHTPPLYGPRTALAAFLRANDPRFEGLQEPSDAAGSILEADSPAGERIDGEWRVFCHGEGSVEDLLAVIDRSDIDVEVVRIPAPELFGETAGEIAERLEPIAGIDAEVVVSTGPRTGDWRRFPPGAGRAFEEFLSGVAAARGVGLRLQRAATREDIQRWADWDKEGGRAGLGFEWVDEELVPGPDYDEVCSCLELVEAGEMSKNKAAAHLGTSPRTITRCIEERPDRYGL